MKLLEEYFLKPFFSMEKFLNKLDFFFYCTIFNTASSAHLPPLDSTVSEDAGIEPRTDATTALAVRRSNNSARSQQVKDTKKLN